MLEFVLYLTSLIGVVVLVESLTNESLLINAETVDLASSFEESVVAAVAVGAQ